MGRAYKYLVLGGGTAAGYCAQEFVKLGLKPGDLCIVSEESVAPYERPALSKGYLKPEGDVRLPSFHTCVARGGEIQTPKWYKDHGIDLLLDTKVVAVDVKKNCVTTTSGDVLSYQTLIVATGARVLRLEEFGVTGAVLASNICYLRHIKDAEAMVQAMRACKGGRAVVIGGGYIGMESTAALVNFGIAVTMVFPEPHIMPRLFTPEIASFYEDYYRRKGVTFVKGTVLSSFVRDSSSLASSSSSTTTTTTSTATTTTAPDKVQAVVLKDGRQLPCDMVVVGVGIRPNTTLLDGQVAMEKGGIKVNGMMRSSNRSVYAVGDCATFPLTLYGGAVRRLEHVDHARASAAHAVHAIMRPEETGEYAYLPYFYSRVFGLSWQFYGEQAGRCVLFGNRAEGKLGAYWVHEGRLVGGLVEGGSKDEYAALARAVRQQPEVVPGGGETAESVLAKQGLAFVMSAGVMDEEEEEEEEEEEVKADTSPQGEEASGQGVAAAAAASTAVGAMSSCGGQALSVPVSVSVPVPVPVPVPGTAGAVVGAGAGGRSGGGGGGGEGVAVMAHERMMVMGRSPSMATTTTRRRRTSSSISSISPCPVRPAEDDDGTAVITVASSSPSSSSSSSPPSSSSSSSSSWQAFAGVAVAAGVALAALWYLERRRQRTRRPAQRMMRR